MGKPRENKSQMSAAKANQGNCFSCQWRERSEWCALDGEDLQFLDNNRNEQNLKTHQRLFDQGDPCDGIYCVESGTIAIRRSDEQGNTVLVGIHHPGETIGYRNFFADSEHTTSAEALTDSKICFISSTNLREMLQRNPSLGHRFIRRMANDLERAEETILQSSAFSIRTRMAHLLLSLKDRFAETDEEGNLVMTLPLARQDIAAMLGARPETVARTIHVLEEAGVARFSGRVVIIPDLDTLLDEIEPETH